MTPIFGQWRISNLPCSSPLHASVGSPGISQSHWPTENGESTTSYPKQQLEGEPHLNLGTLELWTVHLVPPSIITAHEDSRRLCPCQDQTKELNLSLLLIYNRCSPKMSNLPWSSQTWMENGCNMLQCCVRPSTPLNWTRALIPFAKSSK